jgi:hypothetical protein
MRSLDVIDQASHALFTALRIPQNNKVASSDVAVSGVYE